MTSTITPKTHAAKQRPGDRIFSAAALTAGSLILAVLAAVAGFLVLEGIPGVTTPPDEVPIFGEYANFGEYVWPLIFGTIWAAALALIMALPLAIGIALFISHYAPRRLAQGLGYIIDLLAAVPSVVFGLWGANVLAPAIQPLYAWLGTNANWLPFFAGPASGTGRTILTAAIVLTVMVLPIITAISR